jgi:hypothetical protein
MQNLTVQKVVLALITLTFFIGAPWLISETLGGNTLPLVSLGAVAVLLFFVYGLGDRCWLIIPFCLSITGNLNFLPLNFSMQELAILAVFCYLLFRMIFGLDVAWKLGPAILWIPLAGVFSVLLFHWISSGDIGIKLLGGSGWGGRKYFKVTLAILCLPLLASFPGMRSQDLQKVPLVYFLGSFVDIVPDLLTTFVPATAPYVWRIYSGVNLAEFGATLQGNFLGEKSITRFGTLARLGAALGLVTLCYFSARTWLQPNRLWAFPVVLLGGLLCTVSGFRNTIFRYGLSVFAGLFATLRFKSLLLLPSLAAGALAVAFTHGTVLNYPLPIQRSLAFLPGNWDGQAIRETEGSSKWRKKIDELFYKEYFGQAPLLGQGYHFDPELAKRDTDVYLAIVARQAAAGDEFADVRNFIEQRQPHEGPVHALLVSGVVGTVFFVAFCASLLFLSFGSVLKTPPKEVTPIQIWAVALLLPNVLGFFVVFGDYTSFFIGAIPVAALLYRFERLKTAARSAFSPETEVDLRGSPPEMAWALHQPVGHLRQPPVS